MSKNKLNTLKKLGIFTTADAVKAGVSQPTLSRLVANGEITRIARGVFEHPEADIDPEIKDYAEVQAKFGKQAIICLMTALQYYDLIDEVPDKIWVLVPPETRTTANKYRCIRTQLKPNIGVERHKFFSMTKIDRTLVEAFRYKTKVGLSLALSATRRAIKNGLTTEEKIYKMAKKLGYENVIKSNWEAITAA